MPARFEISFWRTLLSCDTGDAALATACSVDLHELPQQNALAANVSAVKALL